MSGFTVPKDVRGNIAVRRRILKDCAGSAAARAAVHDACSSDMLFFVNMFAFTYDPRKDVSVVPFITYPFQEDAMSAIKAAVEGGYDVGIKKSRDMGASWVNLTVFTWFLLFRPMKTFLMVSRNEDLVDSKGDPDSLFWKVDFILKHCPRWLLPKGMERTQMHIANLDNGTVIDGSSTTGDVGRGGRRTAALIDEFAAFESKAGYEVLAATRDMTRCRIFNSTPKGPANAFHDVIFKSSARIVTMHWSQHPLKNPGLYTSERGDDGRWRLKLLSDWRGDARVGAKGSKDVRVVAFPEDYPFVLDGRTRSPWYDWECSRAVSQVEIAQELDVDFTGGDYQYFDVTAVERYKERWCREPEVVGDVTVGLYDTLVFSENPKGAFSMFEPWPRDGRMSRDRRFVIGADVSAGTGASNSTATVYDAATSEKVAELVNPNILPDDFGRLLCALGMFFNGAVIVPDRSGPTGEVCVRRMEKEGYPNIWVARDRRIIGGKTTDRHGVYLNPAEKTAVISGYRDAIGHASIINRSARAMDETLKFVMLANGCIEHQSAGSTLDPSGARSNHGDLVIADALVNLALSDGAESVSDGMDGGIPEGSLAWRMERVRAAESHAARSSGWSDLETNGKEWIA